MGERRRNLSNLKFAAYIAIIVFYDFMYKAYGNGAFVWRVVPIMFILFIPTFINMYPKTVFLKKMGISGRYLLWSNLSFVVVFLFNMTILSLLSIVYDSKNVQGFGWQFLIVGVFLVSFVLTSVVADMLVLSKLRKRYKVGATVESKPKKPDASDIFG